MLTCVGPIWNYRHVFVSPNMLWVVLWKMSILWREAHPYVDINWSAYIYRSWSVSGHRGVCKQGISSFKVRSVKRTIWYCYNIGLPSLIPIQVGSCSVTGLHAMADYQHANSDMQVYEPEPLIWKLIRPPQSQLFWILGILRNSMNSCWVVAAFLLTH